MSVDTPAGSGVRLAFGVAGEVLVLPTLPPESSAGRCAPRTPHWGVMIPVVAAVWWVHRSTDGADAPAAAGSGGQRRAAAVDYGIASSPSTGANRRRSRGHSRGARTPATASRSGRTKPLIEAARPSGLRDWGLVGSVETPSDRTAGVASTRGRAARGLRGRGFRGGRGGVLRRGSGR
jgi:hypothetical protein